MTRGPEEDDRLSQWLAGDGLSTLDGILGEALDVIGVVDRELTIRYLNWTVAGLTPEGLVGRNVLELVPPGFVEMSRDTYHTVLRTGVGTRFETIYRDRDSVRLWDVRVGPIRAHGEVIGLIVVTSNVTEQRQADADRDRFFSLSLDMLVVVTPDGCFKRLNPAFGETVGYESAELIGARFLDFVHADDRSRTLEAFRSVLGGTPVTDFENRYLRKDGTSRVFSWRATVDPVTSDVYAVARDITEHRVTEAQLRHAQKMEAVGQLAGGIAHDFNNLLQAILANAELANNGETSKAELDENLGEITGAGRRAADLTRQLLAFSKRQPLRLVPIDLNQLVRGLMKMLRRLLPASIGIELSAGPNLASVNADPTQLEQVLVNLCVNARDAMERGGELTIRTQNVVLGDGLRELPRPPKPGSYVLMSVTDTGAGMTSDVRERIFEPFFTTKGGHRGTGLGLSTAYGIVQQHDGMIHADSEQGRGTTFSIYLPADGRLATNLSEKIEAAHPRGTETILLAEDEDLVRRVVIHILERAGYRTIATSNGNEAIQRLRENGETVDLVLLDVVMPELGGPETWERIREFRKDLRVLFMSGYTDARDRELLPPDAELLQKPFRRDELLRYVRRILDGER